MIEEMVDQHQDSYLFAGLDVNGAPTYARAGRHGATVTDVLAYRALHPNKSTYLTVELWEANRRRTLRPVEPITAPADALMARLQDLILRSPGCGTEAIKMLTDLQSTFHDLDQHLLDGGRLPSRWTR